MGAERVVLHVGMPKTGSSALQTYLARHRGELETFGVHYPESEDDFRALQGMPTPGNAFWLARFLSPYQLFGPLDGTGPRDAGEQREADLHRFVEMLATTSGTIVLSSEAMFVTARERLEQLVDACATVGATLDIVVYLRDRAPHLKSVYAHAIGRLAYHGSYSDFIREAALLNPLFRLPRHAIQRPRESLSVFLEVLGRQHVHVLHYDDHREDIAGGFVREIVGIAEWRSADARDSLVNRGFTDRELEWILRLRNRGGGGAIVLAGDALMSLPPFGERHHTIRRSDLQLLEDEGEEDVRWINDTFFGSPRLSIRGSLDVVDDDAAAEHISPEVEALLTWIGQLAGDFDVVNMDRARVREHFTREVAARDAELEGAKTYIASLEQYIQVLEAALRDVQGSPVAPPEQETSTSR